MNGLAVILLEKKKSTFVSRVCDTNAVLEFYPLEGMKDIPNGKFSINLLTDVQHGSNPGTSHVFACTVPNKAGAAALSPAPRDFPRTSAPPRQRPSWNVL